MDEHYLRVLSILFYEFQGEAGKGDVRIQGPPTMGSTTRGKKRKKEREEKSSKGMEVLAQV